MGLSNWLSRNTPRDDWRRRLFCERERRFFFPMEGFLTCGSQVVFLTKGSFRVEEELDSEAFTLRILS